MDNDEESGSYYKQDYRNDKDSENSNAQDNAPSPDPGVEEDTNPPPRIKYSEQDDYTDTTSDSQDPTILDSFMAGLSDNVTAHLYRGLQKGIKITGNFFGSDDQLSDTEKEILKYQRSNGIKEEEEKYWWCETEADFNFVDDCIRKDKENLEIYENSGFGGTIAHFAGSAMDAAIIGLTFVPVPQIKLVGYFLALTKANKFFSQPFARGIIAKAAAQGFKFGLLHSAAEYMSRSYYQAKDAAALLVTDTILGAGFGWLGSKVQPLIKKMKPALLKFFQKDCAEETYAATTKGLTTTEGKLVIKKEDIGEIATALEKGISEEKNLLNKTFRIDSEIYEPIKTKSIKVSFIQKILKINPVLEGSMSEWKTMRSATNFYYRNNIDTGIFKQISIEAFHDAYQNNLVNFNLEILNISKKYKINPEKLSKESAIALRDNLTLLTQDQTEAIAAYNSYKDSIYDDAFKSGVLLKDPRVLQPTMSVPGKLLGADESYLVDAKKRLWRTSLGYFPRVYNLNYIRDHVVNFEDLIKDAFTAAYPKIPKAALAELQEEISYKLLSDASAKYYSMPHIGELSGMGIGALKQRIIPATDVVLEEFLLPDLSVGASTLTNDLAKKLAYVKGLKDYGIIDEFKLKILKNVDFNKEGELIFKDYKVGQNDSPFEKLIASLSQKIPDAYRKIRKFSQNHPKHQFANLGSEMDIERAIVNSLVEQPGGEVFKALLHEEYRAARAALPQTKNIIKDRHTLLKKEQNAIKLIDYNEKMYWGDINKGSYDLLFQKAYNNVALWNVTTQLGQVVISSFSDLGIISLNYGIIPTFKNFVKALAKPFAKKSTVTINANDAKRFAGAISEASLNIQNRYHNDMVYSDRSTSPWEWLTKVGRGFSKFTLLDYWDDTAKRTVSTLFWSDFMEALEKNNYDFFRKNGVTLKVANLIKEEWQKHGQWNPVDNNAILNAHLWSEEAKLHLSAITLQKVRSISILPSKGDTPRFISETNLKYLMQYYNYSYSCLNNFIIPMLNNQYSNKEVISGLLSFMGLEYFSSYLKSHLAADGMEIDDPRLIRNTIESLPLIGTLFYIGESGVNAMKLLASDESSSSKKHKKRNNSFLRPARATFASEVASRSPVLAKMMNVYDATRITTDKAINPDKVLSEREWRIYKGLLFFNNAIGVNYALNTLIRDYVKSYGGRLLNSPPKKRKRKRKE